MAKSNNIILSFFWKLSERFSSQFVSLVVTILLARILMPEDYGIIAIIMVFINVANVIVDGGLNTALVQKKDADNTDFSTIFYFSMGFAAMLYAILFAAAPYIGRFYDNNLLPIVLRVLGINLFFNSFNAIQSAYVAKHMMFHKLFYCSLVATLVSGIVGLAMAYSGSGVWALVGLQITMQVVLALAMWCTICWRPSLVFSASRFRPLFNYGWKIFLTNFIIVVYEDIRSLVIGKVYKPSTLAYFDRGRQFPNLIMSNINISLQTILLPAFSNIQDDTAQVKQMMKRSIGVINFFIFPILVGLLVSAKPFVELLLTEKWMPAVPFIQIFCIAFMMMPIQSCNMSAIKALGYSNITLKIEILKKSIETVILIVSFLIGVYAVAWGIVVYNFICILINLYPCRRILNYGIAEQLGDIRASLLISLAMGLAICWFTRLQWHPAWVLLVQAISGLIIYLFLHSIFSTRDFVYVKDRVTDWISNHRLT